MGADTSTTQTFSYEEMKAAVDGDPATDINAVVNGVRWVMKGGAVVVDKRQTP